VTVSELRDAPTICVAHFVNMGFVKNVCVKFFQVILSILAICAALAVIIITSDQLWSSNTCYLSTDTTDTSNCSYVVWLASVSLFASFCVALVQWCTCNVCGLGGILDILLAGFGAVWWGIGASYLQSEVSDANDANIPAENYRNTVIILAWFLMAFNLISVLIPVLEVLGFFARCCGCGSDKNEAQRHPHNHRYADAEA